MDERPQTFCSRLNDAVKAPFDGVKPATLVWLWSSPVGHFVQGISRSGIERIAVVMTRSLARRRAMKIGAGRRLGGMMTGYWLVKSEPDAFSWDQQVANRVEPWTGVRNHMAKNNLKAMRKGDLAFFYHSNVGKQIVGIVEVAREAYPDPTAVSGDWVCVDMQAVRPLPKPVTLADIRADAALSDIALVRQSRLSVMPISKPHWDRLCRMGGWKI
jgi:predicted RNA-binding protein with PUA-like domain